MSVPADLRCNAVVERLSDLLDGTTDAAETELLELHLVVCEGCSAYFDGLAVTVRLLGGLGDRLVAEPAPDVLDAFRRWREGQR